MKTKNTMKKKMGRPAKKKVVEQADIVVPVMYASQYEVDEMVSEMTRYNCDSRINRAEDYY